MTTKEKAYDEALERARDYYKANLKLDKADENLVLEDIFPELAESEDEKIRKEIMQLIQCMHDADPRKERWIAWLEKQKEFVSTDFDDVWEWADCDELTAPLEKYSKDAIKEMCHAWYDKGIELERKSWLEKQGEKHYDDGYADCRKDAIEKACEWLEENVNGWIDMPYDQEAFIDVFKKAMEE